MQRLDEASLRLITSNIEARDLFALFLCGSRPLNAKIRLAVESGSHGAPRFSPFPWSLFHLPNLRSLDVIAPSLGNAAAFPLKLDGRPIVSQKHVSLTSLKLTFFPKHNRP